VLAGTGCPAADGVRSSRYAARRKTDPTTEKGANPVGDVNRPERKGTIIIQHARIAE
jgi:hypothetical protein